MSFLGGGGGAEAGTQFVDTGNFGDDVTFTEVPGSSGVGFTDTGRFDSGSGGSNSGLFGLSSGDFSKAASAFKDLKGDLPKQADTPAGRAAAQAQAANERGQAGGLGQLLQLLAARANMFSQAAHAGAVPTPTRPGGGLLGM